MKVQATSNFADGSHQQGDVFELSDEDEIKRLIDAEAIVAVGDDAQVGDVESDEPPTPPASEDPANPDPLDPPAPEEPAAPGESEQPAPKQPTQAQVDKTLASLNEPQTPPSDTPSK